MDNLSGQNVKGYELKERIGAGGFGAVYRAHQSTVGREVAIKIILPRFANHPDFIRRFETEAQLIARLEHLHIVPLYDYWRDPDGAYLVMRWLKGGSLCEALQQTPFDLEPTALLLDQIATALIAAHRAGIIHRDIKPANILMDEDGNAYLGDFGIAKDLANMKGSGTEADAIIGSPDYIAPEQARSEPVTPQTDIYSLGVTLYEVLTGKHPFPDLTPVERMFKHLNDALPLIETLKPEVSDAVNAVIQKATAKNPAHRYVDVLTMAVAFRASIGILRQRSDSSIIQNLTLREQDILRLIVNGYSNKEIAQELFVTMATVKWYIRQIYIKLGVRSRVQAIFRARELNLIERRGEANASSFEITLEPENPYKGLQAFTSADQKDYFGREKLTDKLIKKLSDTGEFSRFLTVVGPSGSGKSSLVKAGLIPAIWKGALPNSEKWFVVEMLPGALPLDELEIALIKVAAQHAGNISDQLQRDENGLLRVAQLILPNDGSDLLLVIDQFEEVFTLVEDEQARQHFLNLIYAAVTMPRSRVRVVVTLRADFYDRPLHYPEFGELVRSRMETVLPLSAEELERAIAKPAEGTGVRFEPGLVASIVSEVNYQPGALPLLQYALTELFERRNGRLLTREVYQQIGGTAGALAKRADEIYLGLDEAGKETARQMFLRLVTLGEGTEDTRRRVTRSELLAIAQDIDLMDDIIDTYAEYRLLSLDNDPGTRTPTVEVAHEAILREWERLRSWLNDSRDDVRLQRQLLALASEWYSANQEVSFLLRGSRLEVLEKWGHETQLALTEREREYLESSLEQRTKEETEEENRQARELQLAHEAAEAAQRAARSAEEAAASQKSAANRLRLLVAVMVLAVIGALLLSGVAITNAAEAHRNATLSTARELAAASVNLLTTDPQLSLLLAIRAVRTTQNVDGTWTREAEEALHRAVGAPQAQHILTGHENALFDVAYSPDGARLVTASIDGTARVWDAQTGDPLLSLVQADAVSTSITGDLDEATIQHALYSVAYSSDGLHIATASRDGTAVLWDAATGAVLNIFRPLSPTFSVLSVTFSPDGTQLAFAARDTFAGDGTSHEVTVFDLATGDVVFTVPMHDPAWGFGIIGNYFDPLGFSPDGDRLAFGSFTNIEVWDIARHEKLLTLPLPAPSILDIVFSPNGRFLVGSSLDGTARVWQIGTALDLGASTTRELYNLPGSFSITFSPDGGQLATSSPDGTLKVWDFAAQTLLYTLAGHEGTIRSVVFSPDGTHLATASADETARIWQAAPGAELYTIVTPRGSPGIDYNTEGTSFAGADYSVMRIWDALTGAQIFSFDIGSPFGVTTLSPDGRRVAAVGIAGARVWDTETGEEIFTLTTDAADGMDYSPDGRFIATGGLDHIVRIWDADTGELVTMLEGHESGVHCLYYSPDGRYLASGADDGIAIIWDMTTYQRAYTIPTDGDVITDFQFSPDSSRLAINSQSNTGIIWDIPTQQTVMTISGHPGSVLSIAFSPDGRLIASAGGNTTKLWDAVTGDELLTLYGHTAALNTVRFSPNSHYLTTSATDFTVRTWIISRDELLALAESRVARSWTQEECQRYLHTDVCPPDF